MAWDLSNLKVKLEHLPNEFHGKELKVGWPKGKQYEDGTPVAYVAAIQNFGAPEVGIPARPMLKPTVEANKEEWVHLMSQGASQVSRGSMTAFDVMDGIGRLAVSEVQETIAKLHEPELSAVTVLLRKWRKEGRTITGKTVGEAAQAIKDGVDPGTDNKPLNDTGYMIASVTHGIGGKGSNFEV